MAPAAGQQGRGKFTVSSITLTPLPKRLWLGDERLRLGPVLRVHAPGLPPGDAALADLRAVLRAHPGVAALEVTGAAPSNAATPNAATPNATPILLTAGASSAPPHAEGYLLRVSDRRIVVSGRDPAGAFWGVQTLRQLVEAAPAEGGAIWLPQVEVRDWPDFAVRGAHLTLFRYQNQPASLPFWEALITRLAGRAKLNTLLVQVDWMLRYRKRPEMAQKTALSFAQFRRLADLARTRHIRLIPHLQCLSHQFSLVGHGHPEWLLRPKSETYDPAAPGLRALLHDLMADLRDACGPVAPGTPLHVGLDEVEPGLARKGRTEADVFLEHLRDLHDDARATGFAGVAFWPDMLARYDQARGGRRLLARVPPGTIVCPWNYADRTDFSRLLDPFAGLPFPVWATGSAKYEPDNLPRLARAARRANAAGLIASTWNSWAPTLLPGIVRPLSGLLIGGEFAWNAGPSSGDPAAPLRLLGYDPATEVRRLLAGLSPVA